MSNLTLQILQREEHEKRLKALRKELDGIAATQWMYSPIEKLLANDVIWQVGTNFCRKLLKYPKWGS